MAIIHLTGGEAHICNGSTNLSVQTPSYTSTAGARINVGVFWGDSAANTVTISDTLGNTYTEIISATPHSDQCQLFTCKSSKGGSNQITFALATGTNCLSLVFDEYSGTDNSVVNDSSGQNSATGTNTITSGSFTSTVAGELIYAVAINDSNNSATAGSGYTVETQNSGGLVLSSEDQIASGVTTASMSWGGNGQVYICAATFKPGGGSVTGDTFLTLTGIT